VRTGVSLYPTLKPGFGRILADRSGFIAAAGRSCIHRQPFSLRLRSDFRSVPVKRAHCLCGPPDTSDCRDLGTKLEHGRAWKRGNLQGRSQQCGHFEARWPQQRGIAVVAGSVSAPRRWVGQGRLERLDASADAGQDLSAALEEAACAGRGECFFSLSLAVRRRRAEPPGRAPGLIWPRSRVRPGTEARV
jgi:hypothetical protein